MIATIFLTNNCNMACKYCYEGEKSNNMIDKSTIDKIVVFIKKHMIEFKFEDLMVVIHGGEPLIPWPELTYIVDQFKQNIDGVYFSITTNSLLLTDQKIDYLVEEFRYISVSVDGDKYSHDSNRVLLNGTGTYDIIMPKINKLLNRRDDIRARMTFNSTTVDKLSGNVIHLLNCGFKVISPVPDHLDENWDETSMKQLSDQLISITDYTLEMKKEKKVEVGLINEAANKKINSICSGGESSISIDTDGSIYPCTLAVGKSEFIIGNIIDGIQKTKVAEIKEIGKTENESCIGCARAQYCTSTRCKIINKITTNDFHTPSPIICNLEHISCESSKYYIEKEKYTEIERR
ncbi:radical SAM protein [Paenibacillus tritici]|uniref:radical SAM/SPASM domain-containing protein n=1 Tax=Paenibacillus tritici TaxID=1873425 RepID=UPI001BA47FFE|nr:radical SAM protein [Paenibacillus tritici]QUL56257.1 radical SAM protein [Paenibacillus tritici]